MSGRSFDLDRILEENNLSCDDFAETGLKWDHLEDIGIHHAASSQELATVAGYISARLQTVKAVHSLKARVKDPEHLIGKIIRKKIEKPELDFQLASYEQLITDLMGIRALHLFKHEWLDVHTFIKNTWELHERPIAYLREGDPQTLRDDFASAECDVKTHPFGYRSVHYLVKCQPDIKARIVEIQVRTIFEEGWSEIDHQIRYPRHSSNPFLAHFLTIFNRLSGSADEMGTFINSLSIHFKELASRELGTQAQLNEKKAELDATISKLAITEKEKATLQQQIAEIQRPSSRTTSQAPTLNVDALTMLGSMFKPEPGSLGLQPPAPSGFDFLKGLQPRPSIDTTQLFAGITSMFQRRCSLCGNDYTADSPMQIGPPLCASCRPRSL